MHFLKVLVYLLIINQVINIKSQIMETISKPILAEACKNKSIAFELIDFMYNRIEELNQRLMTREHECFNRQIKANQNMINRLQKIHS